MENFKQLLPLALCLPFALSGNVSAADYVVLDFETPATGSTPSSGVDLSADPEAWEFVPAFDNHFGDGNFFEISDTSSHSGNKSLRFTYEARNGFCNTCGSKNVRHIDGLDNSSFFVAKTGEDLTQEFQPPKLIDPSGPPDGPTFSPAAPHASEGKTVFNKTRGYTKYEIVSVQNENAINDKLILKKVKDGIGSFAGQPDVFNSKDEVLIARQCGVDGNIGIVGGLPDLTRRNDCDGVISWFGNIPATAQPGLGGEEIFQPPGGSIFRRVYLKAELVGPPSGHKLNYMRLMRGAGVAGVSDPSLVVQIITIASVNSDGDPEPRLEGFGPIGGASRYQPGNGLPAGLKFERGAWYYVEQEYKAETYTATTTIDPATGIVIVDSYSGNGDGEYRLWFGKSGQEPVQGNPTLEITGLPITPMLGGPGTHMSFWGNMGHHLHSRGSWYMDDMIVSNQFNGKVTPSGTNTATPNAPVPSP